VKEKRSKRESNVYFIITLTALRTLKILKNYILKQKRSKRESNVYVIIASIVL